MAEEQQQSAPAPKGLPIKTILFVAAIMMLEAGGVYIFIRMTGQAPDVASATLLEDDLSEDAPVEVQLITGTYTNLSTNQNWMWEVDIYLKTPRRNEEFINKTLERRKAEIAEGVGLIIRKAQHAHLKEPELLTIQRQLGALVNEIFGTDPDGEPRVERVIIAKCTGLPVH